MSLNKIYFVLVLANVLASGIFVYTANDVLSRWSTDSTIDEMP
jgi:hypothetical protein